MIQALVRWCDRCLSALPPWLINSSALLLTLGLVAIDMLIEPFISLLPFYVLAIGICAWYTSSRWAKLCGVIIALSWLSSLSTPEAVPLLVLWNALIRVVTLVVFLQLLVFLRSNVERTKYFARHDPLTDTLNVRAFREQLIAAQQHALRSESPLTLAYLDLDNFKQINDQHGHAIGDQVLATLAAAFRHGLRRGDILARVGGDEFVLLFQDMDTTQARQAINRLQEAVARVARQHDWPVTLSIGVVTFLAIPYIADEMLGIADHLMYSVKRGGKDEAQYATYPATLPE